MRPQTRMLPAITLSSGIFLGTAAMAADVPKEGSDSLTVKLVVTSPNTLKLADTAKFSGLLGIQSGSAFGDISVRCLDLAERGFCVKGNKDDGQYMEPYEGSDGKGTFKIIERMGKFAGMSGGGDYTSRLLIAPDDRVLIVVSETVHWKLP
jgi:hypothetical protein